MLVRSLAFWLSFFTREYSTLKRHQNLSMTTRWMMKGETARDAPRSVHESM